MNTDGNCHFEDITWQHAVYTRKGPRDSFSFSHSDTTTIKKAFPLSLSIPSLTLLDGIHNRNLEELRNATVLVLVTGEWAAHVSLEAFQSGNLSIERIPVQRYDHLDRLGNTGNTDNAECAELTKAYRALKYHCTMASYEAGGAHQWRIQSVASFLSDVVVLPRLLEETRLKAIMGSFCRATKKALKDSLILAGKGRAREETICNKK